MHTTPRMAAAQTVPVAGDIDANLCQHLRLIDRAAEEDVRLLVFPELSLSGYELALGSKLAMAEDDARLRPLIAAAAKYEMTLVVGAPVQLASGKYIAAFVIAPTGQVHVYSKHHLGAFRPEDHPQGEVPPAEDCFFRAGTLNPIIPWHGRKLAVSICADSAYPSHPQQAAEAGADIYLSCQFAIAAHMPFKMSRLKDAARKHKLTVLFSNYGGPTGGLASAGASCVRTSGGEAIARLPAEGLGLAIAWQEQAQWFGRAVSLTS